MNNEFINVWVLTKDLPSIAKQSNDPNVRRLCEIAQQNIVDSVDSIVVSPDLKLLNHVNVHDVTGAASYRTFLETALQESGKSPATE